MKMKNSKKAETISGILFIIAMIYFTLTYYTHNKYHDSKPDKNTSFINKAK